MKKIGAVTLILICLIFMGVPASAKEYEENGFRYEVRNKKAIVIGVSKEDKSEAAQSQEAASQENVSQETEESLVIPDSLGGFPVAGIGGYAFASSKYVSVTLPDTITSIGGGAFRGCKQLKTIRLPGKLKKVRSNTFSGCTGLTEVRWNSKLESIDRKAFSNCISLKKLALPGTVKRIGDRAFERCYKLSSVTYNRKLQWIGKKAFYKDYSLKTIRIPAEVTDVGDSAFAQCEDLKSVLFQNAETQLGKAVFARCVSLRKAVLPKKIRNIPESSFAECKKLRTVKVPEKVTIIKRRAFFGCRKLKSISLNKKLYAIGDQAFANSGLKKIKLNKNMQFIGNGAFQKTKLHSLKLPSKVTFIGNRVFADCKKLKTIAIPASVKGINPGAFNHCVSLRSITVSSGNRYYCSDAGVLYDKNKTKLLQYPLHKTSSSFSAPGSLKRIRSNAFSGNPYLQRATITAESIGEYAFYSMKRLKSVTLLNGVKTIGRAAFGDNPQLQKVTLPDSVVSIGSRGFAGSGVKRLHIPSGLTGLRSDSFEGCNQLAAFEGGRGKRYAVRDGVLYNRSMTELIKYPAKKSTRVFVAPASVKEVRSRAFDRVSNLKKLEFGSNLRTLNFHAIYKVKKLKSIVFRSRKFSWVSSWSVSGCNNLAVIVGPNTYEMRRLADRSNATLITL